VVHVHALALGQVAVASAADLVMVLQEQPVQVVLLMVLQVVQVL
jgi:hypothetical protein